MVWWQIFETFKTGITNRSAKLQLVWVTELHMPHSKVRQRSVCKTVDLCITWWPTNRLHLMIAAQKEQMTLTYGALAELSGTWWNQICGTQAAKHSDQVIAALGCRRARSCSWRRKKQNQSKKQLLSSKLLIVAVTACTTGVAHTYGGRSPLSKSVKKCGVLQSNQCSIVVSATADSEEQS